MVAPPDIPVWDKIWRYSIPYILLIIFIALNVVSYSVPFTGQVKPLFVLMFIFLWSVYRPKLFPAVLLFLCGILLDLLSLAPVGMNAASFILVYWGIKGQRRYLMGVPYYILWFLFFVVCSAVSLFQWFLYGISYGIWGDIVPVIISTGITVLLFPLVALILIMVHKLLPVEKHEH